MHTPLISFSFSLAGVAGKIAHECRPHINSCRYSWHLFSCLAVIDIVQMSHMTRKLPTLPLVGERRDRKSLGHARMRIHLLPTGVAE